MSGNVRTTITTTTTTTQMRGMTAICEWSVLTG
jgi:hypothetical protein